MSFIAVIFFFFRQLFIISSYSPIETRPTYTCRCCIFYYWISTTTSSSKPTFLANNMVTGTTEKKTRRLEKKLFKTQLAQEWSLIIAHQSLTKNVTTSHYNWFSTLFYLTIFIASNTFRYVYQCIHINYTSRNTTIV